MNTAILLIHCPDDKGIVLSITDFIFKNKGNIVDLDQHVEGERKIFFMRVEWSISDFSIPKDKIGEYFDTLICHKYKMRWELHYRTEKPKMAIMVSKMDHCFNDILSRHKSVEWNVEIPLIISDHRDMEEVANRFDIPFHYTPIGKDNKQVQEEKQLNLLAENQIDFVVLARDMQILSGNFINHYPNNIINTHHSFLPAFPSAKPYHSAYARGVKIIGSTSHFVTTELDAEPIIEQGGAHISHKDSVKDLVRKGRDIEKIVLSKAIWNHINKRILSYNNRTVIFE